MGPAEALVVVSPPLADQQLKVFATRWQHLHVDRALACVQTFVISSRGSLCNTIAVQRPQSTESADQLI